MTDETPAPLTPDVPPEQPALPNYTITRPNLPEGLPYDEDFERAALPIAQKLGLSPNQVQGLIDFYAGHQAQSFTSNEQSHRAEQEAASQSLKQEWGRDFDTRITQAARAARHFGGDSLIEFLNASGAGNNPELIRAFAKVGAMLGEDTLKTGDTAALALSPAEAMSEARRVMADPAYRTAQHPDHARLVERVRQLFHQAYAEKADAV